MVVWNQRPTQKDELKAQRHDTRYRQEPGDVNHVSEIWHTQWNPGWFYVFTNYFSEWGTQRGPSQEVPALICVPGGEDGWTEERGGEIPNTLSSCLMWCHSTLTFAHACVTQLLSAMVAKLGNMDDPLPQESFEGVDEDEWVSGWSWPSASKHCYCNSWYNYDNPPSLTSPNWCVLKDD